MIICLLTDIFHYTGTQKIVERWVLSLIKSLSNYALKAQSSTFFFSLTKTFYHKYPFTRIFDRITFYVFRHQAINMYIVVYGSMKTNQQNSPESTVTLTLNIVNKFNFFINIENLVLLYLRDVTGNCTSIIYLYTVGIL